MTIDALNTYLKQHLTDEFKWGEADCLIFTNGAYRAMYGEGWCDDWLGRYMNKSSPKKHSELIKEFGFDTLEDGVSSKLTKIDYIAPLGGLVTARLSRRFLHGQVFGISNGQKAIFHTHGGYLYYPLNKVTNAWVR